MQPRDYSLAFGIPSLMIVLVEIAVVDDDELRVVASYSE